SDVCRSDLPPPVAEAVAQALRQDPGLARPCGGDDARRTRRVGHCGQLVRRQVGRGRSPAVHVQTARPDRLDMDDLDALDRSPGTSVDPDGPALDGDVAVALGRARSQLDGAAGVVPAELAAPTVVAVDPGEEVEAVPLELEPGLERIRRHVAGLRLLEV